jgi:signal transduction histidine kinase
MDWHRWPPRTAPQKSPDDDARWIDEGWIDRRWIDRRWIDIALVVSCLALTALAVKTPWSPLPWPVVAGSGIAGSLAVGLRRSRPIVVTLICAGTMALSGNPGPILIALFAGTHSMPRRRYPALAALGVAGIAAPEWIDEGRLAPNAIVSAVLLTTLVMAVGGYVHTHRQLMASLRERADRAEGERLLRDEQARAGERTRIAREMHDVLAHKVSLISLHAGGLEVNPNADPSRIEQGAAVIRVTAQEALAELRAILGVLRADTDDPVEPAGPDADGTFAELPRLVESWQAAGATITLRDEVGTLPPAMARTVYRLVQEGLTNAHRHAPGSEVVVSVTGSPGNHVTVLVSNQPSGKTAYPTTGSGVGLVGLAERLRLLGGTMHSGADDVGGWRLEGRLPWPSGVHQQQPPDGGRGVPGDQGSAGRR